MDQLESDKLNHYRQIIKTLIHRYAQPSSSDTQIESIAICDPIQDSYMLIDIGGTQPDESTPSPSISVSKTKRSGWNGMALIKKLPNN
jgi:hypothetical protein